LFSPVTLHWLPDQRLGFYSASNYARFFAWRRYPAAQTARITRASTLDVMRQDYVRTARSKGILESNIRSGNIFP